MISSSKLVYIMNFSTVVFDFFNEFTSIFATRDSSTIEYLEMSTQKVKIIIYAPIPMSLSRLLIHFVGRGICSFE
jgi:hypothetical protein